MIEKKVNKTVCYKNIQVIKINTHKTIDIKEWIYFVFKQSLFLQLKEIITKKKCEHLKLSQSLSVIEQINERAKATAARVHCTVRVTVAHFGQLWILTLFNQ